MSLPSTPSLQLGGGVQVLNPTPLDVYEGPYASLAAANAAVPSALRSISGTTGLLAGRTVIIDNGTIRQAYWWDGGVLDSNLVLKSAASSSGLTSFNGRTTPAAVFTLADLPALTGYAASPGAVSATDTPFTAIQKIDGNTKYIPLGTLFNINSVIWNTSGIGTNFTRSGTNGTYTFGSSALVLAAGTGTYTDYIFTAYKTNLTDFISTLTYTHQTANTAGTGIVHSYGVGGGIVFTLDTTISSASKIRILNLGIDVSGLEFLDNTINIAVGDVITYNVTQLKNKFIFSILVNTSGVRREYSVTWNARIYDTTELVTKIVNVGIANIGGSHTVTNFSAVGKSKVGADLAIIGDSYLFGYELINNNVTLSSLIESRTNGSVITCARPGNAIADLISTQSEVIALAPKNVYVNIGANDMASSPSTVFASLQSYISALQITGINVFIGKVYPRASGFANTVTFNNLIDGAYPSSMVIDLFNISLNAAGTSYNPNDSNGTHWTITGVRKAADQVWSKIQSVLAPRSNYENPAMFFNQQISKTTIQGYPVLQNSIQPVGSNAIGAITNSQTTISLSSSPRGLGFALGYARIGYLSQIEYVKITGIDEIANTILIVRGQLGTTNQSTAGSPFVTMLPYVNSGTTNNYHIIEFGGLSVFNGLGSYQGTHTFYVPSGSNNGLAVVNTALDGSAFQMISRQSNNANGALRFMTGASTFNYDIILQGAGDLSIARSGQTDLYLTGGMFGFGTIPTSSYINIKEGTTSIAPLRMTGCSLAISSATGNGAQSTFTFAVAQPVAPIKPNTVITVSGFTPSSFNGIYTVVSSTTTQLVVGSVASGTATVNGTISQGAPTTTLIPGAIEVSQAGDRITHVPFGATFTRQSFAYLSDITASKVGVTDGSSATAGNIGENISSVISTYTNYTATATYQQITSVTLTPGDWEIQAFSTFNSNTSTITASANAVFVIATATASATGSVEGQSVSYIPQAALVGTSKQSSGSMLIRVSISATTTYYLNSQSTFTIGNPQFVGSLRATRIR